MYNNFKIGDKVKTLSKSIKDVLDSRNVNNFTIQYFIENNKRCYLTNNTENGWMIEEITNLKAI